MLRNRTLTVRLSDEELALLPALRHAIVEEISQAEVLVWALEDLCRRIAAGDNLGSATWDDGVAMCSAALAQLERARRSQPSNAPSLGRPPRVTSKDRAAISNLRQED